MVATLALVAGTFPTSQALGQGAASDAAGKATPNALKVCLDAFDLAQTEKNAGKLLSARKPMESCAAPACPDAVRGKCVGWLGEIEAAIPSVVVSVVAPDGSEPTAYQVFIDGTKMAEQIDGQAIELEPGSHTVRVEGDGQVLEQTFLAKSGEKNRSMQLKLEARAPGPAPALAPPPPPGPDPSLPPEPPPPDDGSRSDDGGGSGLTLVGIGALVLGATGLGVGAVTGALAISNSSDLEALCVNQGCARGTEGEDVLSRAQTLADVSTIMFVVGGVLATAGLTMVIADSGSDEADRTTGSWVAADVGLGSLGLRGAF